MNEKLNEKLMMFCVYATVFVIVAGMIALGFIFGSPPP